MKQEAPQPRRSRTGIPAIHGGEHVKLTKIAAALSGALGLAGLGFGAGFAYADPGHGHGHGDWGWDDDHGRDDWRGPYYGPACYGPPSACIQATGPFGFVSGGACI